MLNAKDGGVDLIFQRRNLYLLGHDGLMRSQYPMITLHIQANEIVHGRLYRLGNDFSVVAPRHADVYVADGWVKVINGDECNLRLVYRASDEDMSGNYIIVKNHDEL